MAVPAWFWPANGDTAQTVGSALSSAGIVLPDWRADTFKVFDGTGFATTISGAAVLYPGGAAITSGGAGDSFTASYNGPISHLIGGDISVHQVAMPANIYAGITTAGSDTYAVTSTGLLLDKTGAAIGPGFAASPTWGLAGSGTTLYTMRPSTGDIGTFTASSGATGSIVLPAALALPYCMAVSGAVVAVGGTSMTTLTSGAGQTAFTLNPANPTLLLGVDNGTATIWLGSTPGHWALSTSLGGIGEAVDASWVPTGTQALVTNGSAVEVLGYSAGTLTLAQTLTLANAGGVVVMPTSADALVCQPGSNQYSTLTASLGVWNVTGTSSADAGIGPVVMVSPSQVAIGMSGSVLLVNFAAGVWTPLLNVAVPFTVTQVAVDSNGTIYAASAGHLSVIVNHAVVGTGTWSGSAGQMLIVAGQVIIPDPLSGLVRIFGTDNGTAWTQRATLPIPGAYTGLGSAGEDLFIAGTGGTVLYNFGAPYALVPVQTGAAGFWNGSAWTTASLGVGQVPSAITIDVSGNAQVATVQNNLYAVTPGGGVTPGIVPQYAGQTQDVPLGVSSLCVSGTHLFATTSMPGVVVQVA